jgi:hypothetical protein
VGRVLRELGGFAESDVSVLLDPDPGAVLAALDRQLARLQGAADDTMLLFYYSGHADAGALYPHGRALPLSDLRARLSDGRAGVRIGVIDACRGGGWTGTKGLNETELFAVDLPSALQSQGSVLIASSSGLEDAHESEQIEGSFFTHHWIGALRGAGDRNRDNQVSLNEAFDYARDLTIRDSALHTASPQHPSFSMQLRGRSDLPLSNLVAAGAVLSVDQHQGPLELVHLGSGVILLELPAGARSMRLALVPGRYMLRRRLRDKVWAKEVAIKAGERISVDESGLILVGSGTLATKYTALRPLTLSTLPAGKQELTFAIGVSHGGPPGMTIGQDRSLATSFVAPRAFGDRLQWLIPSLAFSYRFGEQGGLELVPWGGIPGWGLGFSSMEGTIVEAEPGIGLDLRQWLTPRSSLEFGLDFYSALRWHSRRENRVVFEIPNGSTPMSDAPQKLRRYHGTPRWVGPTTWRAGLTAGYTHTLADTVTLHLGAAFLQNVVYKGELPGINDFVLSFGSVQTLGLRSLPLVRIHVTDWFALNAEVAVAYRFARKKTEETYMGGASFLW